MKQTQILYLQLDTFSNSHLNLKFIKIFLPKHHLFCIQNYERDQHGYNPIPTRPRNPQNRKLDRNRHDEDTTSFRGHMQSALQRPPREPPWPNEQSQMAAVPVIFGQFNSAFKTEFPAGFPHPSRRRTFSSARHAPPSSSPLLMLTL